MKGHSAHIVQAVLRGGLKIESLTADERDEFLSRFVEVHREPDAAEIEAYARLGEQVGGSGRTADGRLVQRCEDGTLKVVSG